MPNSIAVVGAAGFIGSHLVRTLREHGFQVRTFLRGQELTFDGIDTVYNCGGVSGGGAFLRDNPLAMVGPNVRLALDVYDAALRDKVRHVIVLSSTTGYPEASHPLKEDEYFQGDVAPCYRNPGETRRFIERLGLMYPFSTTFIRCAGAYGPGDKFDPATSHVIGATIRKVAERHDPLICWGNGQDERDGTYIDDLIVALVSAMYLNGKEAINIGSSQVMTIDAIIKTLCQHAGFDPVIFHDTSKPQMIKSRQLDCDKARNLLNWEPKVGMDDGLRMTYDWYMTQFI